jgi:hypothetical protein
MAADSITVTWSGFKRGFWRAQPMSVGVMFYGLAFGLLSREADIWLAEALAMSAVVYSGTAQIAAASALTGTGISGGGSAGMSGHDASTARSAACTLFAFSICFPLGAAAARCSSCVAC